MEAAGLAFAVVAAFKDAYLTAKFIKKTAHTIKHFRTEQASLLLHLDVQIIRLKNFSRIFRGANGNEVDIHLLKTVPSSYLQTIRGIFGELQKVLSSYTRLAATLDEDYKKHSPLSPHFNSKVSEIPLYIDDDSSYGEVSLEKGDETNNEGVGSPDPKGKRWSLFGISLGGSKAKKSPTRPLISIRSLPEGVQWLFTKEKLQETLKGFQEWNEDLQDLIPPLLDGFGFYTNKTLQDRLIPDEGINIFEGHIKLNKVAHEAEDDSGDAKSFIDTPISWEDAKAKISEPRVLVEYKQSGIPPKKSQQASELTTTSGSIKELYAPQLAALLRTAGNHNFRTLRFNSYAWDGSQNQYAFLFDYPSETADRTPKSLQEFVLSGKPEFKLELKQRFHIAQTVARSIGAFHSDGWLHKSIRSRAIKFFFQKDGETCEFDKPYLTDFELSRPVAGVTRLLPRAINIEHDIYQHPERYGRPMASFSKIHDIYSLGVVLLEIGLWQTAKQVYDDIVTYELGGVVPENGVPASTIKKAFLQDAKTRLAHRMGSSYQQAVVTCLNGDLDEFLGSRDFANEFHRRVVLKVDIKAFIG